MRLSLRVVLTALLWVTGADAVAADTEPTAAQSLREQYAASAQRLGDNAPGEPLLLESSEGGGLVSGAIHARVDRALGELAAALEDPRNWCELLVVHPNVARCEVRDDTSAPVLALAVTKRIDAADAHHLAFTLQRAPATPGYFGADLTAAGGPMGTRDYRIRLEAVAIDAHSVFLRLRYSYRVSWTTRLALRAWLATAARDCVGFTVTRVSDRGTVEYIRGMRGSAERNVMRYFLAIDAFLRARSAPADERFRLSLRHWLDSVARYPRQLWDDEIALYVAVKERQNPERWGRVEVGIGAP